MSDEGGNRERDSEPAEKDASSADSTERENVEEVPEYEGQWAALRDGKSSESNGSSDESSGSNDPNDK